MAHSALVVPVPELEGFARHQAQRYDARYLSADPAFAHAHITVLAPFLGPADLAPDGSARVAAALASYPPFEVTLERIATFPDGTIHLCPEPAEPLAGLTDAVCRAFPHHLPYGGRHGAAPPPHLTLDMELTGASERSMRAELAHLLPVRARIGYLSLSWYEPDRCRELARWPLLTTAGRDRPPRPGG